MSKGLSARKTKCPVRSWFGLFQKQCMGTACAAYVIHPSGNGELHEGCAARWIPYLQMEQNGYLIASQKNLETLRNAVVPSDGTS